MRALLLLAGATAVCSTWLASDTTFWQALDENCEQAYRRRTNDIPAATCHITAALRVIRMAVVGPGNGQQAAM